MFGGGMRQAGILAAAGIYALENMIERLKEDHERAYALAQKLSQLEGLELDLNNVQTNMVYLSVPDADALVARLKQKGVLANAMYSDRIRLVTHHQISDEDIDQAARVFAEALEPVKA
jgi:threonine aldolase